MYHLTHPLSIGRCNTFDEGVLEMAKNADAAAQGWASGTSTFLGPDARLPVGNSQMSELSFQAGVLLAWATRHREVPLRSVAGTTAAVLLLAAIVDA